jgi:hypothetical protein
VKTSRKSKAPRRTPTPRWITHYIHAPWCWGGDGRYPPMPTLVLRELVWWWPELWDREAVGLCASTGCRPNPGVRESPMTEYLGDSKTYEDLFPARLRPPPVPPGTGSRLLDAREPVYTVELDAGAFRALWEYLEGEARHRYATTSVMSSARALLRAVDAFRSSYWSKHVPPVEPNRRRLLVGRSGNSQRSSDPGHSEHLASPNRKVIQRRK